MTEYTKGLPAQPKDAINNPEATSSANIFPTSNVHVVSPDHLMADSAREHRGRRNIIILLVLLGLVFLVGFSFIGWYYYKLVYSAPKVFTTDCFELSLPASYTKQTGLASGLARQQETTDRCVVDQAKQGFGGVLAGATKKPVDTSRVSLQEYTTKVQSLFEKVINQSIAGKGRQISNEVSTLDGVAARKIITEQDIGDKQKVIMHHYIGVRNGKFFMISWFYNPIGNAAKSDIEKSIASFRWK